MEAKEEILTQARKVMKENRSRKADGNPLLILLVNSHQEKALLSALKELSKEGYHVVQVEAPYENSIEKKLMTDPIAIERYIMKTSLFQSLNFRKTILYLPFLDREKSELRGHLLKDVTQGMALVEADNETGFKVEDIVGIHLVVATYKGRQKKESESLKVINGLESFAELN